MTYKCDHLLLIIEEHSCKCGNKWTHSWSTLADTRGTMGGTPRPQQEDKLPYLGYQQWQKSPRQHSACFRCILLTFGVGWIHPVRREKPLERKQQPPTELDDLIDI